MTEEGPSIAERVAAIRARIEEACRRAGRDAGEVRLLAVTKNVIPEQVEEAAACGVQCFGENRVQEARQKIPLCPDSLEWHFIGHLQTNKVRDAVRLFRMIHSVDSERLLRAVDAACGAEGVRLPVCIEVNIGGEGTKYGAPPASVPALVTLANELVNVTCAGLMAIPPPRETVEEVRPFFRRLRLLRDECRAASGAALPELSMGMSGDFEVAIEEGATWIRVGTALFGPRRRISDGGWGET